MSEFRYLVQIEADDLGSANELMDMAAGYVGHTYKLIDVASIHEGMVAARRAADGDSNDSEIEALQDAVESLAGIVGEPDYPEVEYCCNCGEDIEDDDMHAGDGMCGSCNHNATRSGA